MKYEVLRGQTKVGSYDFDELKALYQAGVLLPTDIFWIQGMPDWKPLSSLLTPKPSLATSPSSPSVAPALVAAPRASFGGPSLGETSIETRGRDSARRTQGWSAILVVVGLILMASPCLFTLKSMTIAIMLPFFGLLLVFFGRLGWSVGKWMR